MLCTIVRLKVIHKEGDKIIAQKRKVNAIVSCLQWTIICSPVLVLLLTVITDITIFYIVVGSLSGVVSGILGGIAIDSNGNYIVIVSND